MASLSWQDLANQGYNPGGIIEAQAQHQSPEDFQKQEDQFALATAIQKANGPTFEAAPGYGSSNPSGSRQTSPGMSWDQAMNIAKNAYGGGGGQQQPAADPNTVDMHNYLGDLGTLVMRNAMGSGNIPVVGLPQPQSGNLSKGGIADVPGATYTNPSSQALQQALFGGTGQGQVNTQAPGVFTKAPAAQPTQPWAVNPAVQATGAGAQQATPFAQPPAAPSAQGIGLAGPPSAPTPNTLGSWTQMPNGQWSHPAGMISGQAKAGMQPMGQPMGMLQPPQVNPMQIALGQAGAGQAPQRMAAGGPVPGRGRGDTVPAMLTPGEFVMNPQAVQNIGLDALMRANRGGVQHFAYGGPVNQGPELIGSYGNYDPVQAMLMEENMPRRGARQPSTDQPAPIQNTAAASQRYSAAPQMTLQEHDRLGTNMPNPSQAPPGGPPQSQPMAGYGASGYGGSVGQYVDQRALQAAMQAARGDPYQAGLTQADPFGVGGSYDVTGAGQTVGQYMGANPSTVGNAADWASSGFTGPGAVQSGMGGMGGAISGGIGAIGSALQQMFKGPPSWQPQRQAFGGPGSVPTYYTPNFQRQQNQG